MSRQMVGGVSTTAFIAVLMVLLGCARSNAAQSNATQSNGEPTPLRRQSTFLGSVPTGDATDTLLLSLRETFDLVTVARSNIELANQTLAQAQDRFAAGVASNLDVVQAQESVASANQSHIASLYAYNLAKISLAQAIGIAEQAALQYLGVK